ncbi:MAG: hypothetical protein LBG72_03660 [Spirochaetaceae bacterium]|jgi:hypothetical protein|nr:hypothetical protein [Spirochaetaceae bacterium]
MIMGGGGSTPDPNAVKIDILSVYHKSEGAGKNLLTYDPATKNYSIVIEDETKDNLVADAAGAGNTTIKIKYKAGGIEYPMPLPKQNAVVSDIPLPTDGNDTEIYFECGIGSWDGEAKDTITVKVTTPTPTLENLSVRYTSEKTDDTKDLIKYAKSQTDYTITAKRTDNKITIKPVLTDGQEIKVTLKDSKPGEADTELTAVEGAYEAEPGEPGGYNKQVEIKIKYKEKAKENIYNITLVPPSSADPVGYKLISLKVSYTADIDGGNQLTGNKEFSSSNHKYTLSPNSMDGIFTNVHFTAASEAGSKITVTYSAVSEMTYTGDGTASVSGSAAIATVEGESRTLKFKVTRNDGQNAEWSVTINAPSNVQTWNGTITYAGSENYSVQGLVVKNDERSFQAGNLTSGGGSKNAGFEIEAPNAFRPKTFLVQLFDDQGRAMQTVPLEPSVTDTATSIGITIADKSKLTYIVSSANNFYDLLNSSANREVSYSLFNAIDLRDYTDAGGNLKTWKGPTGYSGHFYGNGYTIKGLELSAASATASGGNGGSIGLFSSLGNGAIIEDFTLEASTPNNQVVDSNANIYFGGMLALVDIPGVNITIKNIKVKGEIKVRKTNASFILCGGIIGEARRFGNIAINNCSSELNIAITGATGVVSHGTVGIGGFIGRHFRGGDGSTSSLTFTDCYAQGNVSVELDYSAAAHSYLGGFMGDVACNNIQTNSIIFDRCYASGNVEDTNAVPSLSDTARRYLGGFIGGIGTEAAATNLTLTIKNSAAVGNKAMLNPPKTDCDGRIAGYITANSPAGITFINNIANSEMLMGTGAPYSGADGAATKQGAGKTMIELSNPSTWTGTLGWSADTWDFDGLTKTGDAFYLPRLK